MLKLKKTPELSDNGEYTYCDASNWEKVIKEANEDEIMVFGEDLCKIIMGGAYSFSGNGRIPCLGAICNVSIDNKKYRIIFNHTFSSIMKVKGRSNAYYTILKRKRYYSFDKIRDTLWTLNFGKRPDPNVFSVPDTNPSLLIPTAFDVETGGASGIRCVTFYNDKYHLCIDCRAIKKNKNDFEKLKKYVLYMHNFLIAHNAAHDIKMLSKFLGIKPFTVLSDTMLLIDQFEFRGLKYLAGVLLGFPPYAHELEIANKHQNFDMLMEYCLYDSIACYELYKMYSYKNNRDYFNQLIMSKIKSTMLINGLKYKNSIYDVPEYKGYTQKQMKDALTTMPRDLLGLFYDTWKQPTINVRLHVDNYPEVTIPDNIEYKSDLWYKLSFDADSVLDAMAKDLRYDSPEISAYRFRNNIKPVLHYANYNVDPHDVLIVNDVCCVSTKEQDGWTKCNLEDIKELFNGVIC